MKKIYFLLVAFFLTMGSQAQVVISQVYGAGGNTGAVYNSDFVELFNRGALPQDLTGWSIQYASATGSTWQVFPLTSVVLQPGQYYLIQGASGTNGVALPTPDVSFTSTPLLPMSGTSGKLALVSNTTALTGTVPTSTQIVDAFGYGATATFFETAPTASLSAANAGIRLNNGCTDTNNNSLDFAISAPTPRNTASPTSVCSSNPSLTITAPANGAYLSPETTSVNVTFNVSNFNVANGTGNGHIHYTINSGGVVMKYDTTPISVPTTPGNTYVVYMELVDNTHTPISPAVNATVTFEVTDYINAFSIAEVRNAGAGDYVNFLGQAVVTYSRLPGAPGRNQKYIEDATGAILIDDNTNNITTTFVVGDGISNVRGLLSNFNGTLQLLPNQNATKPSTGNTITPQVVSAATISANLEDYESELVQINNATFTTADGTIAFASSQNYNLNDGSDIVFRTLFSEANYIGSVVPQGAANRIVIVSDFNGTAQVVARSATDSNLSATSFNNISGLNVYPNPANDFLHITTAINGVKNIAIYDVMGKEVLNTTTANEAINVASLNAGVYLVKITEEGKTATRKLVIK